VQSSVRVISISDTQVRPEDLLGALSEVLPTMQTGLTILFLPPIGLLLCSLIGFRPPRTGGHRTQISWMHAIPLVVAGSLLALVLAAAIPPALRLPQFFSGQQPIKASEVVSAIHQLLSMGLLSGLLLVIDGLVVLILATVPGGLPRPAAVGNRATY
jgi:hypothetical protein